MHLSTYNPKSDAAKLNEPIQRIDAAVLRWLVRGRNAWHSTWVRHYFDGCLHDSMWSAKQHAEGMRRQGSVFYIAEIPAIVLATREYYGVVAQINVPLPLADYQAWSLNLWSAGRSDASAIVSLESLPYAMDNEGGLLTCRRSVALAIRGQSLSVALASFAPDSPFWERKQPTKNSVLRAWQLRSSSYVDVGRDQRLVRLKSYTQGPDCELGWNEEGTEAVPAHFRRLADDLGRITRSVLA